MLNKISYWNRMMLSGVEQAPSEQIGRKIELANQISMLSFLIGTPVLIFFIFFVPYLTYILATVAVLIVCLLIPHWNGKGYYNFTRIFICLATTLSSGLLPLIGKVYLFNDNIGVAMYYIPRFYLLAASIAPLLLIDLSEKKRLIACLALNAFFLLAFDWIDSLFGVGFYQKEYTSPQYFFSNFYILTNYLFILAALLYLQLNNKNYDSQIISLNQTLDRRVQEKTRELENANTDLAAYNFMVSHELKTSLTAAQLISRSMATQHSERLGIHGKNDLTTIDDCLNEMQKLIRSILNFSRLSNVPGNLETQNMNSILDEVLSDIELSGLPENVKISIKDIPDSKADHSMMKLVFMNLISNAIKYSKTKEKALIEIGGRNAGEKNIYYVKDNGIGFSMNDKDKMFKLFERLHSKNPHEGSGLGLAIVERIVSRHGGTVWAEGEPEEGAIFYFSLPIK